MSDLPEGWADASLGMLVDTKSGNSKLIKGKLHSTPGTGRVRAYSASGQDVWCDEAEWTGSAVVLSAVGARCGKAFLANGEWTAIANTHVLKPRQGVHARLLWYRLNDENFWIRGGTAQPFVKMKASKDLPILLPPVAEQERIVAAIEEHFSHLDAAEAALRRAERSLGALYRSSIHRTFGVLDDREEALSEIAAVISGQTPKGLVDNPSGSIPFFKVGDMNDDRQGVLVHSRITLSDSDIQSLGLHVRPAGTIVFPKRGGAIATNKKRVLGCPAAFDLNTMGVIPGPDLSSTYLRWWFETVDLDTLSDGSNVPQINHGDISPLMIPVPGPEAQARICDELDGMAEQHDRLLADVKKALKACEALRRSILAAAFCGRLVPQDPDDEPASVLLDRIRAATPPKKKSTRRKKAST